MCRVLGVSESGYYRYIVNKDKPGNARMESFFATLKKELLYRIPTYRMAIEEVKSAVFRYVFAYYNRTRVYTKNPFGLPPAVYRRLYWKQAAWWPAANLKPHSATLHSASNSFLPSTHFGCFSTALFLTIPQLYWCLCGLRTILFTETAKNDIKNDIYYKFDKGRFCSDIINMNICVLLPDNGIGINI